MVTLGGEILHATVDISQDTELLKLEHLYSGYGLEMAGCSADTGKETAKTLFRYPGTELLQSVELNSGDCLEMAGHSVVQLGREHHVVTDEVFWDGGLLSQ